MGSRGSCGTARGRKRRSGERAGARSQETASGPRVRDVVLTVASDRQLPTRVERPHQTARGRAHPGPSRSGGQLYLTEHFPGFGLIEKSHDDSGVLALQTEKQLPRAARKPPNTSTPWIPCPGELSAGSAHGVLGKCQRARTGTLRWDGAAAPARAAVPQPHRRNPRIRQRSAPAAPSVPAAPVRPRGPVGHRVRCDCTRGTAPLPSGRAAAHCACAYMHTQPPALRTPQAYTMLCAN